MLVLHVYRVAVFGFWVSLLLAPNNCYGDNETVEVVGGVECADCVQHNITTSKAFSGLGVTINCKSEKGMLKRRGGSELDQEGKFRATLPNYEIAENGELKEDCFAQLHSASGAPCAIYNNQEASKIVFKSKADGKQVFGLTGNLKFYPMTCTSALLWPFFKYPPLPHLPNWPFYYPPPQQEASPPPPPSVPIFPAPNPVYGQFPPPAPTSKPPRLPPVYTKPLQPPTETPILPKPLSPPILEKPLPPTYKSNPQIPKAPPIPELPPIPTTPRKFFNQPICRR